MTVVTKRCVSLSSISGSLLCVPSGRMWSCSPYGQSGDSDLHLWAVKGVLRHWAWTRHAVSNDPMLSRSLDRFKVLSSLLPSPQPSKTMLCLEGSPTSLLPSNPKQWWLQVKVWKRRTSLCTWPRPLLFQKCPQPSWEQHISILPSLAASFYFHKRCNFPFIKGSGEGLTEKGVWPGCHSLVQDARWFLK